jgi:hypothetical protein
MTLRLGHTWKKILCSINRVRSRSGWSKTSNALWARRITPTVLSTKLGIGRLKIQTTWVVWWLRLIRHDYFECPSLRDYLDTKSWQAYEQNPYSTHWVRWGSYHRETSLDYDILLAITRLRANMNIRLRHAMTAPRYSEFGGCTTLP